MNWLNTRTENPFTDQKVVTMKFWSVRFVFFFLFFFVQVTAKAWEIDFSRRSKDLESLRESQAEGPSRRPASSGVSQRIYSTDDSSSYGSSPYVREAIQVDAAAPAETENAKSSWFSSLTSAFENSVDVVVMNTVEGFVPSKISLRKGRTYRLHIANLNEKEKNTSFLLDAFSIHQGVYFGSKKTFNLSPKVEGVFSFVCPETAAQGQVVVVSDESPGSLKMRSPAQKNSSSRPALLSKTDAASEVNVNP